MMINPTIMKVDPFRYGLFALLFIALVTPSMAQHSFGVRADGGASLITSSGFADGTSTENFWKPSLAGGVFYEWAGSKRSRLLSEVTLSYLQSTEETRGQIDYNGADPVYSETITERRLTYLGMNVAYRIQHKRLSGFAGVRYAFNVAAAAPSEQTLTFLETNSMQRLSPTERAANFDRSDFGILSGIGYEITPRIGLDFRYYHGLKNLRPDSRFIGSNWTWRTQRMSLGVRYAIFHRERPADATTSN